MSYNSEDLKGMTDITASKLGKKYGLSYRIKIEHNPDDDDNPFKIEKVKNNMLHHSNLEHWHAHDKVLDKYVYLNQPGRKRLTQASQYECNGSGELYIIPYHIWSAAKEKKNSVYRSSEYKV